MRRIPFITTLLFCLLSEYTFGAVEIPCSVRYLTEVYHAPVPPSYYEGGVVGRIPIPGTGKEGYYEKKWSDIYRVKVSFFSGFEFNEHYNQTIYNDHAIIALISWDNGGKSVIKISGWTTNLKYLTEDEIKYDQNRNRISGVSGYDREDRYWEIQY